MPTELRLQDILDLPVTNVMVRGIHKIGAHTPLDKARELLLEYNVKCMPVADEDNRCFGLLSYHHILMAEASGKKLKGLQAWEVCTHHFKKVTTDSTVKHALRLMIQEGVNNIFLFEGEYIRGVISASDILELLSRELHRLGLLER